MRRIATLILALLLVGGCAGAGASPSPSAPATGFALRAWISQALPPVGAFRTAGPDLAIDQGRLILHGPEMAIYPGRLLPNLQQRSLGQAGIDALVDAARAAGLLDGPTDLTGGLKPGAQTGHLLFVIDGVEREVIGDPTRQIVCVTAPCDAAPGTPEAFGQFWAKVHDIGSWLGSELGPEAPYIADRFAVLLVEPVVDGSLPPSTALWPLDTPMSEFGVAWAGSPPARCGVIEGDALKAALAAFGDANELTRWTDDTDAVFGAVVRPLFPGEPDPCT
jgi:hypothetical protein